MTGLVPVIYVLRSGSQKDVITGTSPVTTTRSRGFGLSCNRFCGTGQP
jgi:hypothetical protein